MIVLGLSGSEVLVFESAKPNARMTWLRRVVRPAGAGALLLTIAMLGIAALSARGQVYVRGTDPKFPRVLEPDSLTTLNDRCMVRQLRLTPSIRPVYVNFHPVGFC